MAALTKTTQLPGTINIRPVNADKGIIVLLWNWLNVSLALNYSGSVHYTGPRHAHASGGHYVRKGEAGSATADVWVAEYSSGGHHSCRVHYCRRVPVNKTIPSAPPSRRCAAAGSHVSAGAPASPHAHTVGITNKQNMCTSHSVKYSTTEFFLFLLAGV